MNTENNILIAEFMGATFERKNIARIRLNIVRGEISFEDLKFHSDWNWLMEVVEKIESLHESNNVLIATNITYIQIHNKITNNQETFKGLSETKIESVYNSCIEFIKWHNEQQK